MEKWFPVAAPDGRVILVTAIALLGFVGTAIMAVRTLPAGGPLDDRYAVVAVLIGVIVLYRLAVAVRGYRLTVRDDGSPILWIERLLPLRRRGVPLKRLHAIRVEPDMARILNTTIFSMGGIFGWAGAAMIRDVGYADVYGMNNSKAVVLEFTAVPSKEPLTTKKAGPIYVVTPADPGGFVDAVHELRGDARPTAPGAFQIADLPASPADQPPAAPAAPRSRSRKRRK